jgi:hypothetical protein
MEATVSDLSDDARGLLRRTRHAGEPDAAALLRVRASLLAKVAGGAAGGVALGAAAAGASKTASSAPAGVGVTAKATASVVASVAKGISVAIVLFGAGAAAIHAYESRVEAPASRALVAPRAALPGVAVPASAASANDVESTPPRSPNPRAAIPVNALPEAPATPAPRRAPASAAGSPGDKAALGAEPVSAPSLADDLVRLREAQSALAGGRPARALEAADAVGDDSALTEERDGIRVLARCAMGKQATIDAGSGAEAVARRESERFLAAHPGTALAARIRSACEPSR